MNRKTVSLTHGAITAALTVLLVMLDRLVGGFIMSFLPLPLIVYGLYYTVKESVLTYVVTVLLVMIIPGYLPTTILMITYGFVGLVYVAVFKTERSQKFKFSIVFIANSINYLIMVTFFGAFFGMDYASTLIEVRTFLNLTNTKLIQLTAGFVIFITILLETLIIFLSARHVNYLMKRHRK